MKFHTLVLFITLALIAGCDSKSTEPDGSDTSGYIMNETGLHFDGQTKIEVSHADDLHLVEGSYTIMAWVKVGKLTDYFQDILVKGTTSPSVEYDCGLNRTNQFQFWANQEGIHLLDENTVVEPGRYYHYAVVCDQQDGTAKLYINGVLKVSDIIAGKTTSVPNRLLIGGHNTEQVPKDQNWNGIIYNLSIWSKAKSRDEVTAAMYRKCTGLEENLVACWNLDDGSGATVKDLKGTHQGSIIGNPDWVRMPY